MNDRTWNTENTGETVVGDIGSAFTTRKSVASSIKEANCTKLTYVVTRLPQLRIVQFMSESQDARVEIKL